MPRAQEVGLGIFLDHGTNTWRNPMAGFPYANAVLDAGPQPQITGAHLNDHRPATPARITQR
jgi:hypothetical protein